ncbi:MAG: response regulator [Candidatus Nealsonbacteria bacterium]|nr:response regulator [Candidatus Nealsonbacteria bacterium]
MKKIIIIEDEEIMLDLLQRKLVSAGYGVVVARDGEEGLQKIKESRPDLILLDVVMPKRDGFSVMAEIQKDESLSKIPIIIVSNSGQPVELSRARQLGARDWLVKTEFDPRKLVEKIKVQLGE